VPGGPARAAPVLVWALLVCGVGGCLTGAGDPHGEAILPTGYDPDRRDYASFALANPGLPEPNSLPFMVHRFARPGGLGDALILCRWDQEQMPLRVAVSPPDLGAAPVDEFAPVVEPEAYVRAVDQALVVWQDALEGLVTFERVAAGEPADLRIRLEAREAPEVVHGRLLGVTWLGGACRASGWDPEAERLRVRLDTVDLVVHVADAAGLLPPVFVRRTLVHELGHALGMAGHSPSPGDLMYPALDDARRRDELSIQDVNSFSALYSVPNGAHFVDALEPGAPAPPRPPPVPPGGGPGVLKAPWVDVRFGYEISVPASWVRIEEPHGVFFSDGPTWDHDASLRIFVWPATSVEDFVSCCTGDWLAGAWYRHSADVVVNGRRAWQLAVEDAAGERSRDILFVELGDDRVMMIVAESPVGYEAAWRPWFDACLGSLEIWESNRRRGLLGGPTAPDGTD